MEVLIFVVIVVAAVLLVGGITVYNSLVTLRNRTRNAWSQIDVQLKRRHDLVPNLVETVRGFAAHEKETLEGVIQARSRATAATGNVEAQAAAESELGGALGRLMLVVEQYPDLKADQNFLALQEELTSTENRIGFARQHFNDTVLTYNNRVESFPANVFAATFDFREESFFELRDETEREAPAVRF